MMTPAQPTSSNATSVIIFDWDDTILPSSFVDSSLTNNLSELPPSTRALFREIEVCAEKCLAAAARHGEVLLITNSDEGWVMYSAERYLPKLIPVLQCYRIISARTRYEKFYPNQPLCWKAAAFAHESNEHFCTAEDAQALLERECSHHLHPPRRGPSSGVVSDGDSIEDMDMASTTTDASLHTQSDDLSFEDSSLTSESPGGGGGWGGDVVGDSSVVPSSTPSSLQQQQKQSLPKMSIHHQCREIVSFGDSIEERTAVRIVSDQLDAVPKSVKFITNPTPAQIIGQLVMLTHHMAYVCNHPTDLDLEISNKQAEKCASGYLHHRRGVVNGDAPPSATGSNKTMMLSRPSNDPWI